MSNAKLKILVTAGTTDYKLATKLMGLEFSPLVGEIILVRRQPLAGLKKVRNVVPSGVWGRNRLFYEIWRWLTIRRLIKHDRPRLLLGVYLILHGIHAATAGKRSGIPAVLSAIGDDVQLHLDSLPYRRLILRACRNASLVTVMGPASRKRLEKEGIPGHKIIELQNYQDEEKFSPSDRNPEPEWDLLYAGNLIPDKRVDFLIRAVAALRGRHPRLRLAILGEGRQGPELEKLVSSLGLTENISFLGYRSAMEYFLRRTRIFVMASRSEGMPAAAIEAMYCGLPVILTDVGDINSIFTHGENSLLVPAGDEQALTEALAALLEDRERYEQLRLGALATREHHRRLWGREGQIRAWETIFTRLGLTT